jgi:hypothetical protein
MAQYLDMLRSRGVPVEDMSVESFGTLGAYGGFKTLETVHPLDFAIRLSDVSPALSQLVRSAPFAVSGKKPLSCRGLGWLH